MTDTEIMKKAEELIDGTLDEAKIVIVEMKKWKRQVSKMKNKEDMKKLSDAIDGLPDGFIWSRFQGGGNSKCLK